MLGYRKLSPCSSSAFHPNRPQEKAAGGCSSLRSSLIGIKGNTLNLRRNVPVWQEISGKMRRVFRLRGTGREFSGPWPVGIAVCYPTTEPSQLTVRYDRLAHRFAGNKKTHPRVPRLRQTPVVAREFPVVRPAGSPFPSGMQRVGGSLPLNPCLTLRKHQSNKDHLHRHP